MIRVAAHSGLGWALIASLLMVAACDGKLTQAPLADSPGPKRPTDPTPPKDPVDPPVTRGPMAGLSPMRLLTRYEYDNTLSDLLDLPVQVSSTMGFPSENLVSGFENNAWSHQVSPLLLAKMMDAADAVAAQAVQTRLAQLSPCDEQAQGAQACARQFVRDFLPRAYRRPVTPQELEGVDTIFDRELEARPFAQALEVTLASILQSPQFLYRVELFEAAAQAMPPQDGGMSADQFEPVGPYELASRLSYFLWASMPDEALLEAAARGDLVEPEQVRAQVQRMLRDERAKRMVRQFHRQWLGLGGLDSLVKERRFYPGYEPELRGQWRQSLDAFIDHAYWEEGSFEGLMTSRALFLTPQLAALYGHEVTQPEAALARYEAPMSQRTGLLTQPALMALLANSKQGSPILRGIFVRERMLCQHVPPPPADLQVEAPDPDPNATTREIFAIHTADAQCSGCHALIDPIGFGFEAYDGAGRYRTTENNLPVDTSGALSHAPDASLNGAFDGAHELALRLASGHVVQGCMAQQWFQFAMGRPHDASDEPSLAAIKASFRASGYRWEALFEAIALSDSFRYRRRDQAPDARPTR